MAQTDNFIVVPDQFGVVEGHLLILTKQEASSYSALDSSVGNEINWLVERSSDVLHSAYDGAHVLVVEHGECGCLAAGTDFQEATHAHLHMIPIPGNTSREELVGAINDTLENRWIGVGVRYKDTVLDKVEDINHFLSEEHPPESLSLRHKGVMKWVQ